MMSQHKVRRDLSPLKPMSRRISSGKRAQKPFGVSGVSPVRLVTEGGALYKASGWLNGPAVGRGNVSNYMASPSSHWLCAG